MSKVIWEEGRVAAKVSYWLQWRAPNSPPHTPSHGPILKPHYVPHPWTGPTYDAKRHPDPIRRLTQCTGQTDALADRQIVHGNV